MSIQENAWDADSLPTLGPVNETGREGTEGGSGVTATAASCAALGRKKRKV